MSKCNCANTEWFRLMQPRHELLSTEICLLTYVLECVSCAGCLFQCPEMPRKWDGRAQNRDK